MRNTPLQKMGQDSVIVKTAAQAGCASRLRLRARCQGASGYFSFQ
jgi:hypothetical protein